MPSISELPRASLMIATYDRPARLRASLERAERQRGVALEVVIVDDASPRDPSAIVNEFKERLAITFLRLPENGGSAAARNAGILAASNEVVVQLDDDSWLVEADAVARIAGFLSAHPEVSALALRLHFPHFARPDQTGEPFPRWNRAHLSEDYTFQGCAVALRRSAAIRAGIYPSSFGCYGEEDFLAARLIAQGGRILVFAEARAIHDVEQPVDQSLRNSKRQRIAIANASNLCRLALELAPRPLSYALAAMRLAQVIMRAPNLSMDFVRRTRRVQAPATRMTWREALHWLKLQIAVRRSIGRTPSATQFPLNS